jgi:hypothetical protein
MAEEAAEASQILPAVEAEAHHQREGFSQQFEKNWAPDCKPWKRTAAETWHGADVERLPDRW